MSGAQFVPIGIPTIDSAHRSTILQIELRTAPGLRLTNRLSPFKGDDDFRTSVNMVDL